MDEWEFTELLSSASVNGKRTSPKGNDEKRRKGSSP